MKLELLSLNALRPLLVDLGNDVQGGVAHPLDLVVLVVHEIDEVGHRVRLADDEIAARLMRAQQMEHVDDLATKKGTKCTTHTYLSVK